MTATRSRTVTKRDVQAYVDGQLDPGTEYAEAVEAHLAAHPGTQARVRDYHRQDEAIRARYQDLLGQPVPDRLAPEAIRAARNEEDSRHLPLTLRYTACAALLACAVLIGWLAGQPADRPLERFADRTAALLARDGDAAPAGATPAMRSLPVPGGTPNFSEEGMELVNARHVDNQNMYEARYQDGAGRELRLFVAPDPARHEDLLHRTREDGRRVVYWKQGPLMYALTGDFNQRDLDGFANKAIDRFQERLDSRRYAGNDDEGATMPAGDQTAGQPPSGADSAVEKSLDTSRLLIENDIGDSAPAATHPPQVNY